MDEFRQLRQAVRDYCRLESRFDERVRTDLGISEAELEELELQMHKTRAKMLTLAGVDELD